MLSGYIHPSEKFITVTYTLSDPSKTFPPAAGPAHAGCLLACDRCALRSAEAVAFEPWRGQGRQEDSFSQRGCVAPGGASLLVCFREQKIVGST